MKISDAVAELEAIKKEFGDIRITGGYMSDDRPLENILVTNTNGEEIWPATPKRRGKVDGVYFT